MTRFDGWPVHRLGTAAAVAAVIGWAAEARAAFAVGGTLGSGSAVNPATVLEAGRSGQLVGGGSEIAVVSGIALADTQADPVALRAPESFNSVLFTPVGVSPGGGTSGGAAPGVTAGSVLPVTPVPAPPGVVLALMALPALAAVRLLRRRGGQPAVA